VMILKFKVKQQEAMQWLQANAFKFLQLIGWSMIENIDYPGYTERFVKFCCLWHFEYAMSFVALPIMDIAGKYG
jgi:hypothetical protein